MEIDTSDSGETEAVIIVKASPQVSSHHGETVCCAALDAHGNWLRLYPVAFRHLEDGQKFRRWDRVRFRWRKPRNDPRPESRRVDQGKLAIVGEIKMSERERFLAGSIVTGLKREREAGKSLALLNAEIIEFRYERRSEEEIRKQTAQFSSLHRQPDLLNTKSLIPYKPSPYDFKYRYRTDDGVREGTCQDWEIEATFFRWSKDYGEKSALDRIQNVFGKQYPERGMLLAMGTHSMYPDTWLINGIIRLDDSRQTSLF